jgi:hypothetical protein
MTKTKTKKYIKTRATNEEIQAFSNPALMEGGPGDDDAESYMALHRDGPNSPHF